MSAAQFLINKYGAPGADYEAKYCVLWQVKEDFPWFPAKRIFINVDFKNKLFNAFTELEKAGLHKEIKTYDGCLAIRTVRGRSSTSLHAWGAAIDLNASAEKLGQAKTNFSGRFIAIMKAAGLFWGGDWIHRKDPMHFALYNG